MRDRTEYWRLWKQKRRKSWTPEQREAFNAKFRGPDARLKQKIMQAVRDEARERGVPASVIREEWRVT